MACAFLAPLDTDRISGRSFLHTFLSGIDYNRFNRQPHGPVIPRCVGSQSADLRAICSTGDMTFDNTSGIAQYNGLLVRLEKRFSRRTQFLASYALGSFQGSNIRSLQAADSISITGLKTTDPCGPTSVMC